MSSRYPSKGDISSEKAILGVVDALFLNDKWSDMKIICDDYVFPAHQSVVFPRSHYFKMACSGKFQDPVGEASLATKDPFLIEKVLQFLYKGGYTMDSAMVKAKADDPLDPAEVVQEAQTSTCEFPPAKRPRFEEPSEESTEVDDRISGPEIASIPAYFHARMFAEGDFFLIKELKELATEKFMHAVKREFQPAGFAEVITEIYSDRANYEDFKSTVTAATIRNLAYLREKENPILTRDFLASLPAFTEDLCMAFIVKFGPKDKIVHDGVHH